MPNRARKSLKRPRPTPPPRRLLEILKQVNLVSPDVELPKLSEELADLNDVACDRRAVHMDIEDVQEDADARGRPIRQDRDYFAVGG